MKNFCYRLLLIVAILSISIPSYATQIMREAFFKSVSLAQLARQKIDSEIFHPLHLLPWIIFKRFHALPIFSFSTSTQNEFDIKGYFAAVQEEWIPNDPRYHEQWYLSEIGVSSWWSITQGEDIIIALLDSGVDPNHPDLSNNILFAQGYDFGDDDEEPYDENGHGTAMAGLMVAECGNRKGMCGVAPAAKIIPYKINAKGQDQFLASDLAAAILAAAESPAHIISLSLVLENYSSTVAAALNEAKLKGKIIVAAAGNQGQAAVAYPAYLPWVIGVGAIDQKGQRLRQSNYGQGLYLMAPGANLLTTIPGTSYADWYRGTSVATALVSGVLALLIAQQSPNETTEQAIATLLAACQDVDSPGFDEQQGFGHLKLPHLKPSEIDHLQFVPMMGEVFHPNETVELDLHLNHLSGQQADLYLRLNRPDDHQGQRSNSFKVWKSHDSKEPIAYNSSIASPFVYTKDFILPLYGYPSALLGMGYVNPSLPEGAYELLALLTFTDNTTLQIRKMVWITQHF